MTALVWLGWFAAYLVSLVPTVGAEDSGEFAVVAASLGVSHAPGYPLYGLVGRLALLVPVGDPAFRLNLLSAVSAACACAALFALVRGESLRRFGSGRVAALAAALAAAAAFGLGRALWHQATISDKYSFHLMLQAAVCLAAVRGLRPAAIALLAGVAFSHHMQTLYLVPGLGWLALRASLRPRTLALAAVIAVIGVSPKLVYPPVRAVRDPVALAARPASLPLLVTYLRAGSYARRMAGPAGGSRWRDVAVRLVGETTAPGAVLGVAGLAGWSLRAAGIGSFAWLTIGTGVALTASLEIIGREFYLLPVVWWVAAGLGWLLARGLAASRGAASGAVVGSVAVACLLVADNMNWFDRSRVTLERDYAANILAGLPPRTVLFASGDDVLFPVFYLQAIESVRPDVTVIPEGFLSWAPARERVGRSVPEAAGILSRPAAADTEDGRSRAVAAACLAAGRPVAITNPARAGVAAGLRTEVRDVVWEIYAARPAFAARPPRWLVTRGWFRPAAGLTERQRWLIGLYAKDQRQCADRIANAGHPVAALPGYRLALANPYLPDRPGALNNYALAREKTGDRPGALGVYREALADPAAGAEVWVNAGNLLLGLGRRDEAQEMFRGALARSAPGSALAAYAARHLTGR